jgi:hypothetical protein
MIPRSNLNQPPAKRRAFGDLAASCGRLKDKPENARLGSASVSSLTNPQGLKPVFIPVDLKYGLKCVRENGVLGLGESPFWLENSELAPLRGDGGLAS